MKRTTALLITLVLALAPILPVFAATA